mgnify:CR=1 FL=1
MAKLYYATHPDDEAWRGPFGSDADCCANARDRGMSGSPT